MTSMRSGHISGLVMVTARANAHQRTGQAAGGSVGTIVTNIMSIDQPSGLFVIHLVITPQTYQSNAPNLNDCEMKIK